MALSVFQKLRIRDALIRINTSRVLIPHDPKPVSPLSGLRVNQLGCFYGRPVPTACALARREIRAAVRWQDGRKR